MFHNLVAIIKFVFVKQSLVNHGFTHTEASFLSMLLHDGRISEFDAKDLINYVAYFPAESEYRKENFAFYVNSVAI